MCYSIFPHLDYLFKFLVIGNAGVGKSCLLHQFIEQKCKCSLTHSNYCPLTPVCHYVGIHLLLHVSHTKVSEHVHVLLYSLFSGDMSMKLAVISHHANVVTLRPPVDLHGMHIYM